MHIGLVIVAVVIRITAALQERNRASALKLDLANVISMGALTLAPHAASHCRNPHSLDDKRMMRVPPLDACRQGITANRDGLIITGWRNRTGNLHAGRAAVGCLWLDICSRA